MTFSLFSRREPPPPQPFYKKKPIASIAVILTIVGMFILGPLGVIYNSMSEELKQKVDNTTLQLMIEKDRDALKRQEVKNEGQEKAIIENQKAIQKILIRQESTKSGKKENIKKEAPDLNFLEKMVIPPEMFEKYMKLKTKLKSQYKEYLTNKGYDTEGLPE